MAEKHEIQIAGKYIKIGLSFWLKQIK
jgi:hypothetical protein